MPDPPALKDFPIVRRDIVELFAIRNAIGHALDRTRDPHTFDAQILANLVDRRRDEPIRQGFGDFFIFHNPGARIAVDTVGIARTGSILLGVGRYRDEGEHEAAPLQRS